MVIRAEKHFVFLATLIVVPRVAANAQAKPVWIVGGEENVRTELTDFKGILATPRHVVVLENSPPYLKVIAPDGKVIQTLGRRGSGPGEFGAPYHMSYDSVNNRLLVADAMNLRLTAYAVGDSLGKPETTPYDYPWLDSVCHMSGGFFGLLGNEALAAELTLRGDRLTTSKKFGEQRTNHPLGNHPMVKVRTSNGPMYCDDARKRIIITSSLLGEIHFLSTETHAQQMTAVPEFRIMKITTEGGTMSMWYGSSWEIVRDVVPFGREILAVVETRVDDKTDPPAAGAYRYFVVDASGGLKADGTHKWRPVALRNGRAICATVHPAPTVALFAGAVCP